MCADFVRGALSINKLRLCGTNGIGYEKWKQKQKPNPNPNSEQVPSSEEWIPSWVLDLRPFLYLEKVVINTSLNDVEEHGGCESTKRLRRIKYCQVNPQEILSPISAYTDAG